MYNGDTLLEFAEPERWGIVVATEVNLLRITLKYVQRDMKIDSSNSKMR